MPSMAQKISAQNRKILGNGSVEQEGSGGCNCRKNTECSLGMECLTESLIYRATVNPNDPETIETYVGLCGGTFKSRYNQHMSDFNLRSKEKSTTLSQ